MITKVSDIKTENIRWASIGKRIEEFRKHQHWSTEEAAKSIGIQPGVYLALEENGVKERKSTNLIWNVSNAWNLSLNWLLNGIGSYHDPDPIDLLPETLIVEKRAGVKRNIFRRAADEGQHTNDVLEFVLAIEKYKGANKVQFVSLSQTYEIMIALGYRKVQSSRIAPLKNYPDAKPSPLPQPFAETDSSNSFLQ